MRILFANDGIDDAGGVRTYIDQVMAGLAGRGHELAFLHNNRRGVGDALNNLPSVPYFGVLDTGIDKAIADAKKWSPDVCFSHNMNPLDVERRLLDEMAVVKFMHGYFGTCISGQKMHSLPTAAPCTRGFGAACLALYLPRRCGQARLTKMSEQYLWASRQKKLLARYSAIVVASQHMKQEYLRNGVEEGRLRVASLFAGLSASPAKCDAACNAGGSEKSDSDRGLLFLGRMTRLKGGDYLIRAVAEVRDRTGQKLPLVMAGDGPQRGEWERLAGELKVEASFTGWVERKDCRRLFDEAALLVVPSIWPEPFGLVGLEAASAGVPAMAFDVGGIREWLKPGVNGYLATGNPPTHSALATALIEAFSDMDELKRTGLGAREVAREMSLERHLSGLEIILSEAAISKAV